MHQVATLQVLRTEFARYALVGGLAFCADFTLLAYLTSIWDMHYLLASLFSFLLGTWVNYKFSVRWVFGYRAIDARCGEFSIFMLIGVVTLGLSLALMAFFVDELEIHVLIAKCLVTSFTLIANFGGRRALLFTRWGRPSPVEPAR
jgi:putative flippase GtrA